MLNTYEITCSNILVEDFKTNVFIEVPNVDIECLVPLGSLSRAMHSSSLERLLSNLKRGVRIHFRKPLCVSRETSFNNHYVKAAIGKLNL